MWQKVPEYIFVIPLPIYNSLRLLQLKNAFSPNEVVVSGIIAVVKLLHHANALVPIYSSAGLQFSTSSFEQFSKA